MDEKPSKDAIDEALDFVSAPNALDEACADVTERGLDMIMNSLGIKPSELNDDELNNALKEKQINVRELDWGPGAAALNGLYVYQNNQPIGFVSIPFPAADGKITAKVVIFKKGSEIDVPRRGVS